MIKKSVNARLTIGIVARLAGVGVETIRYYERERMIKQPIRASGSIREYPAETIHRVHFIKRAQELGFSLQEISELLSLRSTGRSTCATVSEKAELKLVKIEEKMADLKRIQMALLKVKDCCERQAPATKCPVLESFYA